MKAISIIYLMSISLCASLCCPEEDDYFPVTITIENDFLIAIQNDQTEYALGDFIFIETIVDNQQQDTSDNPITLSDYDYAEIDQSRLEFGMSLYKLTGFDTLVKIPLLEEHLNIIEGTTELSQDNIGFYGVYNGVNYVNKTGIKLLEAGTYFIGASYSNNTNVVTLWGGDYNTSWISIKSKIVNANEDGFFEFTVN